MEIRSDLWADLGQTNEFFWLAPYVFCLVKHQTLLIQYSAVHLPCFHASDDVRTTGRQSGGRQMFSLSLCPPGCSPKASRNADMHFLPPPSISFSFSVCSRLRTHISPVPHLCHTPQTRDFISKPWSRPSARLISLSFTVPWRLVCVSGRVGPRAGVTGKTQRAEVLFYRRIPFNPRLESGKVQFDIFQTTLRLWFRFMHNLETQRRGDEPFWSSEMCVRSFWVDSLVFNSNLSSVTPV